jgi:hypothetical protein
VKFVKAPTGFLLKKCITFELYYLYITIVLLNTHQQLINKSIEKMQSFFFFGGGGAIVKFKSKLCVGLGGFID